MTEVSHLPKLRVLVVEDELLIRWAILETLTAAGCLVTEAEDGKHALEAASKDVFDAVVLDYRLPDSNDLKLLEGIRARLPNSLIIMMSAFGTADIVQQAKHLGVAAFLDKPFEMERLTTLLAHGVVH